jgi:glycosyltransferase involved in cell wall biosynthesis
LRLAFVVQRYGPEVGGGSELHCRWLAERLARRHQVEVFTTRAIDYLQWRDGHPAGTTEVNGVPVHRFGVERLRSIRRFSSISNVVFEGSHTVDEERRWVDENGPFAPRLVAAVAAARERFDAFLFYSYRYYHAYHGLPAVRDKALLVPTAEDDPAIRLAIFPPLFRMPRGLVYLTPEEKELVERVAGNGALPSAVIGSGLELPEPEPGLDFAARHGLTRPYALYVGRIDKNKGCLPLFEYFRKAVVDAGLDLDLVLAGPAALAVPQHERIRHVGFIPEAEKVAALRGCRLLIMPSPYESLSVVTLEAWKLGVPVLANARCRVLAGQCLRSNGGLLYGDSLEFTEALRLLLERPELARTLGRQGQAYVEREYAWERIEAKLEDLFARALGRDSPTGSAAARGAGALPAATRTCP